MSKLFDIEFKPTQEEVELAKQILGIDYEPHPQCVRCALYHNYYKELDFRVQCKPLPKSIDDPVTEDNILDKIMEDPYIFAKTILGVELRHHQKEMLRCTQRRKVFRLPRRAGKTYALAIYALWRVFKDPNFKVLLGTIRENILEDFFKELNKLIANSEVMRTFTIKLSNTPGQYYRKKPYELQFSNGSVIKGITLPQEEGGVSARGQSGDLIMLDEADYIARDVIVAFLGILGTSPHTEFIQASTPNAVKGFFWNWCNDPAYKEFHWKYQHLDIYNPEQDAEWKRNLSEDEYAREVLAEFAFSESGVFNPKFLEAALEDYEFENESLPSPGIYQFGVDWNEGAAGTHIVVARYERSQYGFKIRITNVIRISPSQFTQLQAVEKIIDLFRQFIPVAVVVDEGYGNTQIQLLKQKARELKMKEFENRLLPLNLGSKVRVPDMSTGAMIEVYIKPFIVNLTARYLEQGQLILPKSEDYRSGLVGQMRNYQIVDVTEKGLPKYSKDYVHTLEAMMMAIYGLWLNSDLIKLMKTASVFPRVLKQKTGNQPVGYIPKGLEESYSRWDIYEKRRERRLWHG